VQGGRISLEPPDMSADLGQRHRELLEILLKAQVGGERVSSFLGGDDSMGGWWGTAKLFDRTGDFCQFYAVPTVLFPNIAPPIQQPIAFDSMIFLRHLGESLLMDTSLLGERILELRDLCGGGDFSLRRLVSQASHFLLNPQEKPISELLGLVLRLGAFGRWVREPKRSSVRKIDEKVALAVRSSGKAQVSRNNVVERIAAEIALRRIELFRKTERRSAEMHVATRDQEHKAHGKGTHCGEKKSHSLSPAPRRLVATLGFSGW